MPALDECGWVNCCVAGPLQISEGCDGRSRWRGWLETREGALSTEEASTISNRRDIDERMQTRRDAAADRRLRDHPRRGQRKAELQPSKCEPRFISPPALSNPTHASYLPPSWMTGDCASWRDNCEGIALPRAKRSRGRLGLLWPENMIRRTRDHSRQPAENITARQCAHMSSTSSRKRHAWDREQAVDVEHQFNTELVGLERGDGAQFAISPAFAQLEAGAQ